MFDLDVSYQHDLQGLFCIFGELVSKHCSLRMILLNTGAPPSY